jgi:hypothetical protein
METEVMRQRLLVMNGQRLVQSEQDGKWNTDKVEKAGAVKPGIYAIHLAVDADRNKPHEGPVIYIDSTSVYQQVGKSFIKHVRDLFDKVPEVGVNSTIKYASGRAIATPSSNKLSRGIS